MSRDESDNYSDLWKQATFMPHDLPGRSDMLRESVAKKLQTNFLAFCLFVSAVQPDLYLESGLSENSARFQSSDSEKRRLFVEYPLFRIWLKQATRSLASGTEVKRTLLEFKRVMEVFEKGDRHVTLETDCGMVELLRFNPDPLILKAVQQDYTFPDETRRKEFEQGAAYPISLLVESVHAALQRIRLSWLDAFRDFFKFVKIVVDPIDAGFKSYSSQELTGVIFVSTNSEPLLLEEYLIHELGHQILLNLMELDPLVIKEETGRKFSLPWSGKEREFYGYLHAFFAYILLYNYFGKVKGRSMKEQSSASDRLAHIGDGLVRAVPELEQANLFTPRGKQLFENLKSEVQRLGLKW
jgi:hypothetical protein